MPRVGRALGRCFLGNNEISSSSSGLSALRPSRPHGNNWKVGLIWQHLPVAAASTRDGRLRVLYPPPRTGHGRLGTTLLAAWGCHVTGLHIRPRVRPQVCMTHVSQHRRGPVVQVGLLGSVQGLRPSASSRLHRPPVGPHACHRDGKTPFRFVLHRVSLTPRLWLEI